MKKLALLIATVLAVGCTEAPVSMGSQTAKSPVTGSAGGSNAQNANAGLESCTVPLGTLALVEDPTKVYYSQQRRYGFVSSPVALRLLAQQSNCFVIVERGRAMNNMNQERDLQESGELREGSNFGGGQMAAADYSLTPDLLFQDSDTGGIGGAVGGILGSSSIGAAVGGAVRNQQAQALLTLIDNRSGIQVAAAEGSSKGVSLGGAGGLGVGVVGALGSIAKTPQDKVVVGAYLDAYNNMIRALRNYEAQGNGQTLGTGGGLPVN